ncbi:MAG: S8/S53 family peptidase [Solirubrobacterales bacterium]|nr:S8/S53 family peptidase [Solirubrobacterales bacterium]
MSRGVRDLVRGRATAATMILCALAFATGALAAAGSSRADHRAAPGGARMRLLGPAPPAQRIELALLLTLPGEQRLRASLAALEDPGSPHFRQLISPGSFGARFGISSARLRSLARWLSQRGLRITASYPQRTELELSGSVRAVERLLRIRIATYADGPRRYHAPLDRPRLPAAMAGAVDGVSGLDTRPRLRPHDVPLGGLTPNEAAVAYDVAPLHDAGLTGQGETIDLISFSTYDAADPSAFASHFGLSGPVARVVSVDGGATDSSGQAETDLDLEVIQAIAPSARVVVYEVPSTSSGYTDVINRIVADHNAGVVSSSWGQCELGLDPAQRTGDSRALTAAVASGLSMFVAAGDSGAYDCQQDDLTDHRLSVDWPAASADAVAVGGTRLYLDADYSYLTEAGWDDPLSAVGGGGGFSTGDPRPSWQTGPGVTGPYSNGHRQLPDVSADADPGTPWPVYTGGQLQHVGGTSAAAPFWASSMLLIEQYAARQRVGRLGYVNPILYALAASRQPYPPFHDVTVGGNRFYRATVGWDPATGLGSPDVYNLARDVVGFLRAHHARRR